MLNVWDWFFRNSLLNQMVMLLVQRAVLFVYILILKRAKTFSSSSISFFIVFFSIERLKRLYEPHGADQEHSNRAIFSTKSFKRWYEPLNAVQMRLNCAIIWIARLNLTIKFWNKRASFFQRIFSCWKCFSRGKSNVFFNFFYMIAERSWWRKKWDVL